MHQAQQGNATKSYLMVIIRQSVLLRAWLAVTKCVWNSSLLFA